MLNAAPELLAVIAACGFERQPAVVAAVSGGSDSTALLLLLKAYFNQSASGTRLLAVTVDHKLRPEAAEEAAAVGKLAARLDIAHRTLGWENEKPKTGLAAAAREARYDLLARAAMEIGSSLIVTAHTADDQAETVFMRRERGEGVGLSGMAPSTVFDGRTWIVRPLLETRREALRNFLRRNDVGWTDDPSNVDSRSERVRARKALAQADPQAEIDALLELARRNAGQRRDVGRRAAGLVSTLARQVEPGLIHLDLALARNADGEAAAHALRMLLAVTGGTPHPPDDQRVRMLLALCAAPPYRATLSRTVVASRRDGIWLCRERRSLPEPAPARDGMIWDGRFRISRAETAPDATIAPAGAHDAGPVEASAGLPASLVRTARACRPVFRPTAGVTDLGVTPQLFLFVDEPRGWSATPLVAPYARFLPCFDLELASAIARLIGARPFPGAPCRGHNVTQA